MRVCLQASQCCRELTGGVVKEGTVYLVNRFSRAQCLLCWQGRAGQGRAGQGRAGQGRAVSVVSLCLPQA